MLLKPKNLKSNVNFSMSLIKQYHHYHHLVVILRYFLCITVIVEICLNQSWERQEKAFDLTEGKKEPSLMQ